MSLTNALRKTYLHYECLTGAYTFTRGEKFVFNGLVFAGLLVLLQYSALFVSELSSFLADAN